MSCSVYRRELARGQESASSTKSMSSASSVIADQGPTAQLLGGEKNCIMYR